MLLRYRQTLPTVRLGIAGGLLTAVLALPFHAAICLRTGG